MTLQLVVLAAGLGRRLGVHAEGRPKPLVDLHAGNTILVSQLHAAAACPTFDRAIVVAGYRAPMIRRAAALAGTLPVQVLFNPNYACAGPMYSLLAAADAIGRQDSVVVNGDTWYAPEVVAGAAARARDGSWGITLIVSPANGLRDDDMRVAVDAKGMVRRVGKTLPAALTTHVSAGMALLLGKEARRAFLAEVDAEISARPGTRAYWHLVLDRLAARGHPVATREVSLDRWTELDTVDDLRRLRVEHARSTGSTRRGRRADAAPRCGRAGGGWP